MNVGLSRSLWLLSACGSLYFVAVFAGGFDYALPPEVYYDWLALFDFDPILAAGCFFMAVCVWLGVSFPILFLGRGSSVRGMRSLLGLLLVLCIVLQQPPLTALWCVLFFFFCANTLAEKRRARAHGIKADGAKAAGTKKGRAMPEADAVSKAGAAAAKAGPKGPGRDTTAAPPLRQSAGARPSRPGEPDHCGPLAAPPPMDSGDAAIRKAAEAVRAKVFQGRR